MAIFSDTEIDPRDKDNCTPLLCAARTPNREVVRALVSEGASLVATDKFERNVIHIAAQCEQEAVMKVSLLLVQGRSAFQILNL